MAVLKPRERLVYFRISEDEFGQFLSVCKQEGARSVSDLARNAVQRLIAEGQTQREDRALEPRIQLLEKLIAQVTAQLEVLSALQPSLLSNSNENLSSAAAGIEENSRKEELRHGNPA